MFWGGKKPRIKFKILCDAKDRGGLKLPHFEAYGEATGLSWIREWMTLQKPKMLVSEGFNNAFGWHSYLFYEKSKIDKVFKHHYIRDSLIRVWIKYRYLLKGRPLWIRLEEVIQFISKNKPHKQLTYQDLIKFENGEAIIKTEEKLDHKYRW